MMIAVDATRDAFLKFFARLRWEPQRILLSVVKNEHMSAGTVTCFDAKMLKGGSLLEYMLACGGLFVFADEDGPDPWSVKVITATREDTPYDGDNICLTCTTVMAQLIAEQYEALSLSMYKLVQEHNAGEFS